MHTERVPPVVIPGKSIVKFTYKEVVEILTRHVCPSAKPDQNTLCIDRERWQVAAFAVLTLSDSPPEDCHEDG